MYLTRRKGRVLKYNYFFPIEPPRNTRIHSNLKPYQTLKFPLPLPLLPRRYWGSGMYKDALGPELFVFVCFFHSLRLLSLSRLHSSVKRVLP